MFNKLFKAEGGFTLVELLVTIAILGVLFGIVTLTLSGVGDDAETTVQGAEKAIVQSAIDIHMARLNISVIDALSSTCLDGSEVIFDDSDALTDDTIGQYLRLKDASSQCYYAWTNAGVVSKGACNCK